jgi:hypothetical protein
MERYENKPFLRLLECYVLFAIEQLDDQQQSTLRLMEPKLQSVYGTTGSWLEIVNVQMNFPDSFPDRIREIWNKNLAKFHESRTPVDPNKFAIEFVDQNFPAAAS